MTVWATPTCPGCEGPPLLPPELVLPCFCPNGDCAVFCWDPAVALLDLELRHVDLDDLSGGADERR